MPAASPASRPRSAGRARTARASSRPAGRGRPRWDRVARVALVLVLVGLAGLYIGPTWSYIGAWRESRSREADVARLQAENTRLRSERRALNDPATLQRRARELGMVRRGERAFVIEGLPAR